MFGYTASNPWQPYVYHHDSLLTFAARTGDPIFDEQSTDNLVYTDYVTLNLDDLHNNMATTGSVPLEENIDEIEQFQRLSNAYTPQVEVEMSTLILVRLLMSSIGATGWRTTARNGPPSSVRQCRSGVCP